MPAGRSGSDNVHSTVMRAPVVTRDERLVFGAAEELAASEVIKRRDRQNEMRSASMYPGCKYKSVSLLRLIPDTCILGFRIVRHLIVVSVERCVEAKLVGPAGREDQVGKAAEAMRLVVHYLGPRRCESVIGAETVQARVIGEALRVIGEADEVVRGVEVSVDHAQLAFAVAAESGARDDAEESVSAVAVLDSNREGELGVIY